MMPSGSFSLRKYQSSPVSHAMPHTTRKKIWPFYMSLVLCDTQKINKILSIPKIPLCSKCLGKKTPGGFGWLVGCPAAPLTPKVCWKNSSRRSLPRRKSWSSLEISPYRSFGLAYLQGMGLFVCFFCWVKRLLLGENNIITKIYLVISWAKRSNSWWFMPCPTCFE